MIKSMTGYGGAKGFSGKLEISAELRGVNNRYLDCTIKLPRVYSAFEDRIKALIQKGVTRGKVDVYITVDSSKAGDVEISVNQPLAAAYITAVKAISDAYEIPVNINIMDIARFPDVLQAVKREGDPEIVCEDICAVLSEALDGFNAMREREGMRLSRDISERLDIIENLTALAGEISPKSVAEYRAKLEARLMEMLNTADIDEARILTEAAVFADRTAINEETVRLRSHISQLRDLLDSMEPVGRKIDFIVQELNREANTIGSKGNDAAMSRVIVDLKAEIEKIREQAQNIE